jgi:hypothetical protein
MIKRHSKQLKKEEDMSKKSLNKEDIHTNKERNHAK